MCGRARLSSDERPAATDMMELTPKSIRDLGINFRVLGGLDC
jgi:hypothetical protein